MTWLVWRQHRNQAYFAAAALAAFAVLLLVTGRQMASQYQSALAACAPSHSCGNLANTLTLGSPAMSALVTLTVVVPCLLGVFWGGPLVARELETGTSQLAWMQGVTRRRWLTVKVGWALLAAAAWGGAVAALDPLARRQFLAHLAEAVADDGLTVVLSSHLVADLERTCDHLILLAASRVQLCGDIDTLLAEHQVLVGPRKDTTAIEKAHTLVQAVRTARQTTLLIRRSGPVIDPAFEAADVGLEELVLGYMGQHAGPAPAHLTTIGEGQ